MSRQKIFLSILTTISGIIVAIFVIISFLKNNFNLLQAIKSNFEILFIHIVLLFCLFREIKICKYQLKEVISEVANLQTSWDPLTCSNELLAAFKTVDDLFLTFNIPPEIYNKLIAGQQGKLAYRERNGKYYFVFFTTIDNDAQEDRSSVL